jgi:hypothetical protein
MYLWGSVPDWITAIATAGSLCFLIDYARSARAQVEGTIRPVVIIVKKDDRKYYFRNIGPGPALNVEWMYMPSSGDIYSKKLSAVETGCDYDFGDPHSIIFHKDSVRVSYESPSGQRYESTAKFVKTAQGETMELVLTRTSRFRLARSRPETASQ